MEKSRFCKARRSFYITCTSIFSDFANRKQSPTENSYRYFNSLASKAEVEQDLKGEVLVVDFPAESDSKETSASVEPEQRAHANDNEKPSVQDPGECLRGQDDDPSVHRRISDGPPAEATGGETDDKRADPRDVRLQDRSGAGFHESQGN